MCRGVDELEARSKQLMAVIYDNIQIKEYCVIIVNKLMKGSYACVSLIQETTFLKHPVWYCWALSPFCRMLIGLGCNKDLWSWRSKYKSYGALRV